MNIPAGIAGDRLGIPAGVHGISIGDVNAILEKRSQNGIQHVRGLEIGYAGIGDTIDPLRGLHVVGLDAADAQGISVDVEVGIDVVGSRQAALIGRVGADPLVLEHAVGDVDGHRAAAGRVCGGSCGRDDQHNDHHDSHDQRQKSFLHVVFLLREILL